MTTAAMTPWPYPLWIAHRGAGKLAPENTLAAFRLGASHGYRMFECDVKLSADGLPFLLHDATLNRTTSATGVAGERPWHELSQLDAGGWHSRAHAGEPIPTLAALARYVRRNGFALNIEIKPTPGSEHHTGRVVAEQAAQLWQDDPLPPLLTSFATEALAGASQTAPHLPRGLLLDQLFDGWLEQAQALGCVAIVSHYSLLDAQVMARIDASGMRTLAYTVNDPAEARRLHKLGIDGLITDAMDRFSPSDGVWD